MDTEHFIALTTVDSEQAAAKLAREVVEARLAACVQIVAIRSVYAWQGAVEDASEQLLVMKTRDDLYGPLERFVKERHPYEVPEIVRVPVTGGLTEYLAWIDSSTTTKPPAPPPE